MKKFTLAIAFLALLVLPSWVSASATTTFGNGLNFLTGCITYAGGACIGGSGSSASSTLLGDNNTFSGNTTFAASTTFQNKINAQQASTTLLTISSITYTPEILASGNLVLISNGSSINWDGGEFYPGANGTKSLGLLTNEFSSSFVSGTASSTNDVVSSLGTPAGSIIASDPTGKLIATSSAGLRAASSTLLGDNNTFSGKNTIAQASTTLTTIALGYAKVFEGVGYAENWAGADIGAQVNTYYAAASSAGVHADIEGAGTYNFSTEIAATTSGKPLYLTCGAGVTLNYTGSATSTVINDTNVSGGQFPQLHGVDGCNYTHTNTGAGDTSVAIEIGGTNGAPNINITHNHILGFGKGIVLGNNAWLENVSNNVVEYNTRALDIQGTSNSGERDTFNLDNFSDCVVTANCVNLPTSSVSSAFFDQMSLDDAGMHIADGNLEVKITNIHIEAPNWAGLSPYTPIVTDSGTFSHVSMDGGTVVISATGSGHSFPQIILNGTFLTMDNITFQNDGGATTLGSAVNNYGNGTLQASGNIQIGGTAALTTIATSSVQWDINSQGIGHAQGTIVSGLPYDGVTCNAASGNEDSLNAGYCFVAQSGPNAFQTTLDPIANVGNPALYALSIENPTSVTGTSTGFEFQVSNAGLDGAVGAAMIFTREGGGSYGNTRYITQDSNNAYHLSTYWANNGYFGVGTSTATAPFTLQAASSTVAFNPVFDVWGLLNTIEWLFERIDEWGHLIVSGPTPSVSGGTSSVAGNDRIGKITVVGTALTSVTLTFAHAYAAAPVCTETDNSTALTADITSISSSQVVFGFSVGVSSATVWYSCAQYQ